MSVADTALVSSTDASTAAYRKLPAAAATPAGNDLAAQSDQGHTVPDSPSSRTSDDSNSSSSDSSSTTQLQEQQHEHRKGVAAKPAGIDISQIDVADVAAAAAAQAAESPDSPKSVPIGEHTGMLHCSCIACKQGLYRILQHLVNRACIGSYNTSEGT